MRKKKIRRDTLGRKQLCRIYVEEHTRFAGRRSGNASAEPQQNHGQYKELYRSDIENKTLYEQYLKEYRDKLLELSTSLLTYYDELINSINIGYQKEKTATGVDYYNEMYVMVKHENDTFDSMKDLVKDLYSGTAKRSNTRYSIWISPEWLCWCGTYIIMAIIDILYE
jgi:hypothetical protein